MSILVAGNYCHDTLVNASAERRTLGGSSAYASAILRWLEEPHEVVANVGGDFLYFHEVYKPPRLAGPKTTSFVCDYRGGERREHVVARCQPLAPDDLHGAFDVGLACGVAGEVTPEVLSRLRSICRVLVADAQSLLRQIGPSGEVSLLPLPAGSADHLDVIKASRREVALLDVPSLRRRLTLVVTDGAHGCTLLTSAGETHLPAVPAAELDPTGAGDCFLAGFAAGIARGLPPLQAARLGAYCGARAVEQVGVPRFTVAPAPEAFSW